MLMERKSMAVEPVRRRFTVDDYYRMAQAGILGEDDRVELIDGEILEMTPIGPPHAYRVKRLGRLFQTRLGDRVVVSVQDPVRLDEHNEPQPDVALLAPPVERYRTRHPGPEDVLLIVEVVQTTREPELRLKLRQYARAGIAEVWVLYLTPGNLVVHREPSGPNYRSVRTFRRGETVAPLLLPELELDVEEALG